MDWQQIAQNIGEHLGAEVTLGTRQTLGGGCVNEALSVQASRDGQDTTFFIKMNRSDRLAMFEAEAEGLKELARARAIRVPLPVCTGQSGGRAYIVLQHLALSGRPAGGMTKLGEQLAALHRRTADNFGWQRDNTIGTTPQINRWQADWIEFWQQQRMGYQLELAAQQGLAAKTLDRAHKLNEQLGSLFTGYSPSASLLHGDLWSGNVGLLVGGEPVIFDPATYYGDREAELAMTELFGGFSADFYAAYTASWPLDPGYEIRRTLYNLYHILNHFNMFGGGYGAQAASMIDRCLAELA